MQPLEEPRVASQHRGEQHVRVEPRTAQEAQFAHEGRVPLLGLVPHQHGPEAPTAPCRHIERCSLSFVFIERLIQTVETDREISVEQI